MMMVELHPEFAAHAAKLADLHDELVNSPRRHRLQLPRNTALSGAYLLSEGSADLYVGRSDDIRARLARHCRPSSRENSASFALRLAKGASTIDVSTYARKRVAELLSREVVASKQRIDRMDVRFVVVPNPVTQALLEVYSAVALGTPHNSFENH